jgi:hypothetical protein
MFEDLSKDLFVLNKGNDSHPALAFGHVLLRDTRLNNLIASQFFIRMPPPDRESHYQEE